MPAPVALEAQRTGTPDATNGIQVVNISSQESSTKEIFGGLSLSDRIADAPSPDRAAVSAVDTATDMSSSGFGTSLVAINNRGAIVVWCEFANAAGSATIEIVFYDAVDNPLFISPPMYFTAKAERKAAAGDYLSEPKIIDTYGASKFKPFLRVKGTGNVDIFANPL